MSRNKRRNRNVPAAPSRYVTKIRSDPFARRMAVRMVELRKGYSKATMIVAGDMASFHGVAHGGAIFTVADAAFAAASNSNGRRSLALSVNIVYRHPVFPGDKLIAEASEMSLGRMTGLYGISVTRADGKLVASAQGTVFRTNESILWNIKRVGAQKLSGRRNG